MTGCQGSYTCWYCTELVVSINLCLCVKNHDVNTEVDLWLPRFVVCVKEGNHFKPSVWFAGELCSYTIIHPWYPAYFLQPRRDGLVTGVGVWITPPGQFSCLQDTLNSPFIWLMQKSSCAIWHCTTADKSPAFSGKP